MLRPGTTGRRLWLAAAVAAIAAMVCAGIALAASETIIGQSDDTFTAATYTTDQGAIVPFQVTGDTHNVTAHQKGPDGADLFRSPTISGGTTGVQGTQYLSAGTYAFFCSVHPSTMQATLVVTANGTPQARPSATVSVRSRKLAKVSKKGILVALTTTAKVDGASLTAKLGKATIGSASGLSLSSGQQFVTVKLSKAGKNKLKGKSTAAIGVTADIPFGAPASGRAKLT
jgi:plastocyanin